MAVVLVVEDDFDTCQSLVRLLQRDRHVVTCAGTGQQAMAALVDGKPELVLLDLKLPEMDGIAFLNVVRSYLRWTTLPVIVITGIDDPDVDAKATKLGVKRIFHKTRLDFGELLATVSQVVSQV
jgi:DNA-binding response OmpR family regulator